MTLPVVYPALSAAYESPRPGGLTGRLEAVFSRAETPSEDATARGGTSQTVVRHRASGPLELRRPISREDRYFLRNVTAGVFGGDRLEVDLTCEAGACARVEATSAMKVFAMPLSSAVSRVRLRAEDGARLTWGPQTTILHAGSRLRSDIEVSLAGGAVLVAETVVMGRLAAGESFAFDTYESTLVVRDGAGRALFAERFSLVPSTSLRDAMGGRGALTTVYALGLHEDEEIAERLRHATSGFDLAGWSVLPNGAGLVAKALVESASRGEAFARACLEAVTSVE